MKKLLAILAVAGFLTACNDNGGDETKPVDSTAAPATVPDTTTLPVDTTTAPTDTTAKPADTTVKK